MSVGDILPVLAVACAALIMFSVGYWAGHIDGNRAGYAYAMRRFTELIVDALRDASEADQ